MNLIYRIPSKVYNALFQKGIEKNIDGDKLIAVYSILKTTTQGNGRFYSYKSKNNKIVSNYALLRKHTNISLVTLKKYIPILIELKLCFFNTSGDFILIGNEKTKQKFNSKKLVPIAIGKNIITTAYNVYFVRVHSSEQKQNKAIEKKRNQSELLKRADNPRSLKELKAVRKIQKNRKEKGFFIEKCVLNINSYCFLKCNEEKKSKGSYWKQKLINKKLIQTKRRFELIKKMEYKEFKQLKANCNLNRSIVYYNGFLAKELVSEFSTMSV